MLVDPSATEERAVNDTLLDVVVEGLPGEIDPWFMKDREAGQRLLQWRANCFYAGWANYVAMRTGAMNETFSHQFLERASDGHAAGANQLCKRYLSQYRARFDVGIDDRCSEASA
jgi:hypothetical protein